MGVVFFQCYVQCQLHCKLAARLCSEIRQKLGGWIDGNAGDQGKARTACKGQRVVVKVG